MAKFLSLVVSLLVSGAVWAADEAAANAEVVLPEPNYVGIIAFLVLMIGSAVWFMAKIMKNKDDGDK